MFSNYIDDIKKLVGFEKSDILNDNFKLYSDGKLEIYYAPHNEIINENAKIFIVGITPGWTQTCIAYKTARDGLLNNLHEIEIKKNCKFNSRFAGSMRSNIIDMLNSLDLHKYLGIKDCFYLFDESNELLHTTSLIPYPVFINKKNYTGSNPKILESDILIEYVIKYFYKEVKSLTNALIIPLGISVEDILINMVKEGIIKESQCLFGFPHPSGANGHRKIQFENNKEKLKEKIKLFFS